MFYHLIIFLFNTIYFARLYRATVIGNNWKLMILKLLIRCLYLKSFLFCVPGGRGKPTPLPEM